MGIIFTKNLEVGVNAIDNQHRELFKKADELFEAGKNGKSKEYILQLFDFLGEYTKTHFKDEENYMLSIKYPEYESQKKMHESFIGKLGSLRKDCEKAGVNLSVIINTNQFILEWLTKHISVDDKKIGQYVKNK
jgi:hemerythrin